MSIPITRRLLSCPARLHVTDWGGPLVGMSDYNLEGVMLPFRSTCHWNGTIFTVFKVPTVATLR